MSSIGSAEDLGLWLAERGIDTRSWRPPGNKRVVDLWTEIETGDTRLQKNPPLRLVNVVQIIIRRGDRILVEAEQELEDGSRRVRNHPPSEKMKAGESVEVAAMRCLKEELRVESRRVSLDTATTRQAKEMTDSPSYPGLPTQYTFYRIDAKVEGLPDVAFWRENIAFADGSDPIKRHRWAWRRS